MPRKSVPSKSGLTPIDTAAPVGPLSGGETFDVFQNDEQRKISLIQLRQWESGQFGIRFTSLADDAVAQTRILLQSTGATPMCPYLARFDQVIIDPFTGPGQFDLVERDADDVEGGDSEVTIATKSGFTDGDITGGWSRLVKLITSDKIYSVVFVPGDAGDGVFSMNVVGLNNL